MGNSNKKSSSREETSHGRIIELNNRIHSHLDLNDGYLLIWLDQNSLDNNLDSLRTKMLLREMNNNHCLFYSNGEIFLSEIERIAQENSKILLILSGSFSKEILPQLRDLISTIIIFCEHASKYLHLLDQYKNVVHICHHYDQLKSSIRTEISSLKLNLFLNQPLKSVISFHQSDDDLSHYDSYFSYIVFLELLKQMPRTQQSKDMMLLKCQDYYRNQPADLLAIENFRCNYQANQAIDWYTKESFIYRLTNRAFRTEDLTLWYLFRYYVVDLCTQLELVHQEQNIDRSFTVYRGQSQISTKELNHLKSNIGSMISTNGFFSSTTDIQIAKGFLADARNTEYFQVVIFEINVSGLALRNTIFVDIDRYFGRTGEKEILFNIGSIFQIENISYDSNEHWWTIQMKAIDQQRSELQEHIEIIRKRYENRNINFMFGRLLIDINQYTKAESYFQMILKFLPVNHQDRSLVYDYLAHLAMKISNWNDAWKYYQLSLKTKSSDLALTWNGLGNYYRAIEDYKQALKYYFQSLQYQNDLLNRGILLSNIAGIYLLNKDYDQAFEQCLQAREILEQLNPLPSSEIIYCQGILGDIYFAQEDYFNAEQFYSLAYHMSKNLLLTDHQLQINSIKSLIHLYHQQGYQDKARQFAFEQFIFHEQIYPQRHLNHALLAMEMAQLYDDHEEDQKKIVYLEKALNHLENHRRIQYATIAHCFFLMAEYYHRQLCYDKANIYYVKMIQIQKQIYPKDHQCIMRTQAMIENIFCKNRCE